MKNRDTFVPFALAPRSAVAPVTLTTAQLAARDAAISRCDDASRRRLAAANNGRTADATIVREDRDDDDSDSTINPDDGHAASPWLFRV